MPSSGTRYPRNLQCRRHRRPALTVVGWTGAVEAAWSAVADGYDLCFDWDFVPGWIIDHIDWSDPAHPAIRPDPCDKIPNPLLAQRTSATRPTMQPPSDEES